MRIGILFLVSLTALFTSFSYANTCPIGKRYDRVEFPLGTPIVYSVCIDGCRGEQKFNDLDTWTCTDNLGKCVALYTLTGQSCTGQDDTDGSCDPTGNNCTAEPDTGNPDPDPDPEPEPTDPNPDSATIQRWNKPDFYRCYGGDTGTIGCTGLQGAFAQLDKVIDNKLTYQKTNIELSINEAKTDVIDEIIDTRSDLADIKNSVERVDTHVLEAHNDIKSIDKTVDSIDKKLSPLTNLDAMKAEVDKIMPFLNKGLSDELSYVVQDLRRAISNETGDRAEYVISHVDDKLRQQGNAINNNQITLEANQANLKSQINGLKNNVNTKFTNTNKKITTLNDNMNSGFDALNAKLDNLDLGGSNDGVIDAVNGVGTKIDGLGDSLEGMGDKLGGLSDKLDGKGLSKGEHGSLINFGETPLYQESEVEKLTQEVADLKEQYTEKVNDFKKLFSLNLDSLSNGEYREHFLDFEFANGAKLRAGSSVFPALIDNSGLIAAVILFVAVIAGLRVVMGAKD